ncbi:MAG TPA: hypothetical protein PLN61_04865 [bacterium]|nr:hypothetical protein [bacterium]HQI47974.1 hypothetical protein [bacterium]HQJ65625.1 hypothetical protein [bacterium]
MKAALFGLAAGIASALLLRESTHVFLFPATLAVLAAIDLHAFRIFRRWKLWLFFILIVAFPVLLVGTRDARCLGVPYNSSMFRLNLIMVERSILLMLAIKAFTNRLSPEMLSRGLAMLHLHQFDQVFRLSQSMLPELRSIVTTELQKIQWRKLVWHPAQLIALLGRLVARLVFTARSREEGA